MTYPHDTPLPADLDTEVTSTPSTGPRRRRIALSALGVLAVGGAVAAGITLFPERTNVVEAQAGATPAAAPAAAPATAPLTAPSAEAAKAACRIITELGADATSAVPGKRLVATTPTPGHTVAGFVQTPPLPRTGNLSMINLTADRTNVSRSIQITPNDEPGSFVRDPASATGRKVRGNDAHWTITSSPEDLGITWTENGRSYRVDGHNVSETDLFRIAESVRIDAEGNVIDADRTGWGQVDVALSNQPVDITVLHGPAKADGEEGSTIHVLRKAGSAAWLAPAQTPFQQRTNTAGWTVTTWTGNGNSIATKGDLTVVINAPTTTDADVDAVLAGIAEVPSNDTGLASLASPVSCAKN